MAQHKREVDKYNFGTNFIPRVVMFLGVSYINVPIGAHARLIETVLVHFFVRVSIHCFPNQNWVAVFWMLYSCTSYSTRTAKNPNFFLPEKPHFIVKPSSSAVTVRERQHVSLPCKAAGFPQPVITWYKNGHVIEERRQVKAGYLEFKEIQFEDRGMYTCTAENLLGRVWLSVNVTIQGM